MMKHAACIQSAGSKTWQKETTMKTRNAWEDDIQMRLKEIVFEMWSGLIWLRIGKTGRPL
jgi:hypothetical protein